MFTSPGSRATPKVVVENLPSAIGELQSRQEVTGGSDEQDHEKEPRSEGLEGRGRAGILGLTEAEAAFIEPKLALAADLRARRLKRNLNQTQVARLIGSSQSRVAKMEAADPSVSVDLLMRSPLKLGVDRKDLAKAVAASV